MKKFLGIVVLGLLLSSNAYAEVINYVCKYRAFDKKIKVQLNLEGNQIKLDNEIAKIVYKTDTQALFLSPGISNNYRVFTYGGFSGNLRGVPGNEKSNVGDVIKLLKKGDVLDIYAACKGDQIVEKSTTDSSNTTSSSSTTTSSSSESTSTYYTRAPSIYSKVKEKRYIRKVVKAAKKRIIEEGKQGKKYHYVFGSDEKKQAFTLNDFEKVSYDDLIKACNYKIKVEDCRVVFDDYYDHQQAMTQRSTEEDAKIAKQLEPYKRICREIGYSVGTDKFGDCVMKLVQMDKKSGEAQAIENANRIERAKILLGLSQMFGQPKRQNQPTSNNQKDMRNLKCTNTSAGFGQVITNCKAF